MEWKERLRSACYRCDLATVFTTLKEHLLVPGMQKGEIEQVLVEAKDLLKRGRLIRNHGWKGKE